MQRSHTSAKSTSCTRRTEDKPGKLIIDDGREVVFAETMDIFAMNGYGKTIEIVWRPDRAPKAA